MSPTQKEKEMLARPANNTPYLVAVTLMVFFGIAGVAGISMARPNDDLLTIAAMVFGFLSPTTLSLLAFMKAQETHLSVNSRLDAFLQTAKDAARAEGEIAGRDVANARSDKLAQK